MSTAVLAIPFLYISVFAASSLLVVCTWALPSTTNARNACTLMVWFRAQNYRLDCRDCRLPRQLSDFSGRFLFARRSRRRRCRKYLSHSRASAHTYIEICIWTLHIISNFVVYWCLVRDIQSPPKNWSVPKYPYIFSVQFVFCMFVQMLLSACAASIV